MRYTDGQRWQAAWERFGTGSEIGGSAEVPVAAAAAAEEPVRRRRVVEEQPSLKPPHPAASGLRPDAGIDPLTDADAAAVADIGAETDADTEAEGDGPGSVRSPRLPEEVLTRPVDAVPTPAVPTAAAEGADAVPVGVVPTAESDGPFPAAVERAPRRSASAADLASATLLRPREDVPSSGWRRVVHTLTGGAVNPGLSAAERHQVHLIRRIRTPVTGRHRIAVVSLKGGIGKTTTTACLGLTLSHYRGDRVVAVDANPDAGTLAERLTGEATRTVHDLLAGLSEIGSYTDVSAYTYLAERLQVLASGQDPEMSHAFDEEQYRVVVGVLERYFNIIVTDSGTGLLHSAMAGTLALADSLVVVGAPSVDGATRAAKTLDWLVAHGYDDLVFRSVAVISSVRPATKNRDLTPIREHFADRCRTVVEIPYDPHLVAGGRIAMSELRRPTADAFLALSADVADGFALPR
ncbi:MAG: AAA family ATPase [Geodermatophilaceae bacterium]